MPTIYCASKAYHWPLWQFLRAQGLPIRASWIDSPINRDDVAPSPEMWSEHWKKCLEEAAACDVLLFLDRHGENQCGSLIELSAALVSGRRVFLVSENWWSIEHHPNVTKFASLEAAIKALGGSRRE
jgi:hypothetical protein